MRRLLVVFLTVATVWEALDGLELKKRIRGNISPKSIVHSGTGLFFAQNMMYRHSITVYNRDFELVTTISDRIKGNLLGTRKYQGEYRGSPVEATFTHGGRYAWITNYQMFGRGFQNPGSDTCESSETHDISYLYKIDVDSLRIELAVAVGSVPKYIASSPDDHWVVVSNWCSGDISIVDANRGEEVKRLRMGRYPRGIVIDSTSSVAYVAVMGSYDIAAVNLSDFKVSWLRGIGRSPRHLALDPAGKFLYASLNAEDRIAKIDLTSGRVVHKVSSGETPRSLVITDDGKYLYVVNYESDTMSKIDCGSMTVVQTVKTDHHPIGITYDPQTKQVWVSCYSGTILVFQD